MHVCVRECISFLLPSSFSYSVYIALLHVVYQESQICMCTSFPCVNQFVVDMIIPHRLGGHFVARRSDAELRRTW